MKLELRVPACRPIPEVAAFIQRCEEAGLDGVAVNDSQFLVRDTYLALGAAALRTSRITLASAVSSPVTRHPSVLASLGATLAEMAPGRVRLTLGSGASSVAPAGAPRASLAQLRHAVSAVRGLLAGERVEFNGVRARLGYAPAEPVPVFMSASGPRSLELAGEVADGVLVHVGLHPAVAARVRELVARGAERAGRDPAGIEIVYGIRAAFDEDVERARERYRPVAATWLLDPRLAAWLEVAGVPVASVRIPDQVRHHPDLLHAQDWEEARRATAFLPAEVLAQVCQVMGVIGPAAACVARLQEAQRWGVDRVFLMPHATYTLPEHELAVVASSVAPALRSAL